MVVGVVVGVEGDTMGVLLAAWASGREAEAGVAEAGKIAVSEKGAGVTGESAVVAVGLEGFENVAAEGRSSAVEGLAAEVAVLVGPDKVDGQLAEEAQVEAADLAAAAALVVQEVQQAEAQEAAAATEVVPRLPVGPSASPASQSTD